MKPAFENSGFINYKEKKHDSQLNKLVDALKNLNKVIAEDDSLGSGFCIGHSYLCELGDNYDLESIVEYDIIPMLREYWFDNNERFSKEAQKLREAINDRG
jgi:5-methylcytosine-specific restriction protein B